MDAAQWLQGIGVVKNVDHDQAPRPVSNEKKPRPQKEQALNCPRCNSANTKFCYYNNYSLTQPRYFCKTCRRYWTEGGSLRNVPVGGGSRKNKRSHTSSSSSSAKKQLHPIPDLSTVPSFSHTTITPSSQNPKFHGAQDLNLAYNSDHHHYSSISDLVVGLQPKPNSSSPSPSNTTTSHVLKNIGSLSSRELMNSFMPIPILSDSGTNIYPSSVIPSLNDFKPTLNFSLDGFEINGYGNHLQGVQETNAKMFFPNNVEDLKPVNLAADEFDHHHQQQQQQNRGQAEQSNNGYWSGMLGGGSW